MKELFQYKILLVYDNRENFFSITSALNRAGYHCDIAFFEKEAVQFLLKNEYGLIIFDISTTMNIEFGLSVSINRNLKTKGIPMVFISEKAIPNGFFIKGYENEMIGYLKKTFDENILLFKVRNFLQFYHTSSQLKKANLALEKKAVQAKISFQDLYYSLPQTVFLINRNGIIVNVNRSGMLCSGLYAKDILQKHYKKAHFLVQILGDSENSTAFRSVLELKDVKKSIEFRLENPDNTILYGEANISLAKVDGDPHILVAVIDITEKKKAEELLKLNFLEISNSEKINTAVLQGDSINKISGLLLNALASIASINASGVYLYDKQNNKLNLVGEFLEENIISGMEQKFGNKISTIEPPLLEGTLFKKLVEQKLSVITSNKSEIKQLLSEYIDRTIIKQKAEWAREFLNAVTCGVLPLLSEGDLLGLITFSSPKIMQEDEKQTVLRFSQQAATVLAIKKNETALAKSEERFELAMEGATDGLWDWDILTNEVYFSKRWKSMLGYKVNELEDNISTLESLLHSEDKERACRILQQYFDGKLKEYKVEFRMKHKNGSYVDVLARGQCVRDKNGQLCRIIGTHVDITEHKKADLELSKTVNELSDKYNELMQFNYIVSHNLRGPIANILGLANILNLPETNDEEKPKIFAFIKSAAIKMDTLIKDLSNILTNRTPLNAKKVKVSFTTLIQSISDTLENQILEANAVIKTEIADEAKDVFTFSSYMESILYNLISNAIKYKSKHRPLQISFSTKKEDGNILILVSDNGRGIDMTKHGENIFGLYRRFHMDIEGKGLGLHMTKTQVEALGGKITVDSIHHEGTTFKITLPL